MQFPWVRVRRLTRTPNLRRMVRSVRPSPDELVASARVGVDEPGKNGESLALQALEAGVPGIYLAPVARRRDAEGTEVWRADAPLAQALTAARAAAPELGIFAELDLAMFHRSGRPGHVSDGMVDAESAHEALGKAAITLGEAGADVVAVRGQVDGVSGALREALDEAGMDRVAICAFSADLYSPFTELRPTSAEKAADLFDPMDPGAVLRQADADVSDGADMIGVQPCTYAQDLIRELADEHQLPLLARITDHEQKALEAAARAGVAPLEALVDALHGSLIRAGARIVVTPWATLSQR